MLAKILKWIGIVLGGLIGLAAVIILTLFIMGNARLHKRYTVEPETVVIPTDAAAIQEGQRRVTSMCTHCHGEDLAGKIILDDPSVGYVAASNLTPGKGGAGSEFSDADWVLALRHGVDPEGRALLAMPSGSYYYLSDYDLSDDRLSKDTPAGR